MVDGRKELLQSVNMQKPVFFSSKPMEFDENITQKQKKIKGWKKVGVLVKNEESV